MDRLTEQDRGIFLVTTYSGTEHVWEITDEKVAVARQPVGGRHHPSMAGFPTTPYEADVKYWPEVGSCFVNIINGGYGDIPCTRSSTVQTIERLA